MTELPSQLQQYIHLSRYSRWLESEGRRENWDDTVDRYCNYWSNRSKDFPAATLAAAIKGLEVMPSMRALMAAGPALDRDNMAGYNCSYIPIDSVEAFDEILYILMCGTGVGFSVERDQVEKLPNTSKELVETSHVIEVGDSRIGWAQALRELLRCLYNGEIPKWDVSAVRKKGAPLKTFGGRASGPAPLVSLFEYTIDLFKRYDGDKLTPMDCHDLVCKIADVVVVGGVRRSALISLSNLQDDQIRGCKSGKWWVEDPHRALANNSVAYTRKPDSLAFLKEWTALVESKSGERGIYNREGAEKKTQENGRRESGHVWGVNPCGEVILRPHGLCNLTEVIVRSHDSLSDLLRKVKLASILGTFQSTLTDFRYVRDSWKKNADEERLLGVSLTGMMDHPVLSHVCTQAMEWLRAMKHAAVVTNREWAKILGVPQSVAVTTVKPSGTVSQLTNTASGIHPRYSEYYVRTVRADKTDPLAQFMRQSGFPVEDDVTKPEFTDVFSFPVKSPKSAILRKEVSAIEQLEHYLMVRETWCEHTPSITVYVRENEWFQVGSWVYDHFDRIGGVSFLPYSDHSYQQAPYQEIDKEQYDELRARMPTVNWSELALYENSDRTNGSHELACTAGACDII